MRKFLSITGILCSMTFSTHAGTHASNEFILNSANFFNQDTLPSLYTCDGKDVSPDLNWTGAPAKTETFALILSDPDAPSGTFYHWVLYNLPATTQGLAQGINKLPAGSLTGMNTFGNIRYNGPCPPKAETHHYIFTLYALDTKLTLTSTDAPGLIKAMQNHIIATAELMALYKRP